jgi:multiple sugar transport system substrate-binding protein
MRRVSYKVIFVLLLVVLLSSMAVVTYGQSEPIEMGITWWGSQDRHDRTIAVLEAYEAANPNIHFTYEFNNFADYWVRLNTQAAGGQLACIMQQDYALMEEWQSRDLLLPLDPYIADGTIDTTNIADSALAGGIIDGQLYGVNLGMNSQAIMIDTDMVEQAGLEMPPEQWTWAEFEDFAMQLHEKLGVWAIGGNLSDVQLWKGLYMGHNMQVVNEDGTGLAFTDDQPLTDYFNMIMRLQDAGAAPTQEEQQEFVAGTVETQPIVTGRAAMDYLWSNQVVASWTAAGEDRHFVLRLLPRPEGGVSENYIKPSQFFSITSQCEHPLEAAQFINHFTNDLTANETLFAERGVPISDAVREHLEPMLGPAQAETFNFVAAAANDSSPIWPPDPAGWADVVNNVYNPLFVDPVLYRQVPIEDALVTLHEEADAILAQNAQ